MTDANHVETPQPNDDAGFAEQAAGPQEGLLREFCLFLAHNKKWWLVPILVVLLLTGALLWIGATAAAPFIYTLF